MKPSRRDVVLLLSLQIGGAVVLAALVTLLPMGTGSNGWVGLVGVALGAQSFILFASKRHPDGLDKTYLHWLAVWAALAQGVLGALFGGAAVLVFVATGTPLPEYWGWLVLAGALGIPLAYLVTRLGLRMGLRLAARSKVRTASAR
jgi:hypothetical protein